MDYFTYLRNLDYMGQNQNNISNSFTYEQRATMPWPLDFQNKSVQYNLNKLISAVKDSVENERNDEIEYQMLAKMAPNEEQKEIINNIKDNEIIHGKIFRKIFNELTGVVLPESPINMNTQETMTNKSYKEMLKDAFMGELKAIERYRELLAYAPNKNIYNMIMYVLTDEIRHAFKYQYLMMENM